MFYKFIRPVARFVVWALNGHLHVYNKERIPNGNYILVAPHRTWWEHSVRPSSKSRRIHVHG